MTNNKGALLSSDVERVKFAIATIRTMWMPPSGGFFEDGKSYAYIDFVDNKKSCLEALDVVREFVERFAPDFEDEI